MGKSSGSIGKVNLLFNRLDRAIFIILNKNLKIKTDESLLIIYDSKKAVLAKRFKEVAKKLIEKVDSEKVPVSRVNGAEPPKKTTDRLLKYDTVIFLTQKSYSHTAARRKATVKGIRIASMPGIKESILKRSINIDYDRLKEDTKDVADKLNKASKVKIATEIGTNIEFSIRGRKAHGLSAGIYDKKAKWGNLPEGEAFIAPVEGTAEGVFVIDGSIAGFGLCRHPLIVFVERGKVTKITDGKKPPKVEAALDKVGEKARNIAEMGIGLNRKAKITGVVLEDEKAYGTCHIALGNNIGFGGKVDVPLHIDCVIRKPTILLDGKPIMKKGKLV